MAILSNAHHESYERDGFLVLDPCLDRAVVASVHAGIDRVSAGVSGLGRDTGGFNLEKASGDPIDASAPIRRPGLLRKIQGAIFEVPELLPLLATGMVPGIASELAGRPVHYHSSKAMFKPPGGAAKPWHQDAAYWKDYGPEQIAAWIAFDQADAGNGCVWVIPGSHRLGLLPHGRRELQVALEDVDLSLARPVPVSPGGVLFFHSLVLHMSPPNTSDRPRLAVICDYDARPNRAMDAGAHRPAGMDEHGVWLLTSRSES